MQKVLTDGAFENVLLTDRSPEFAQLALQGPKAETILARLTAVDLGKLIYYHFIEGEVAGVSAIISRTGYTGEDGFELYFAAAEAETVWTKLLETGSDDGLVPIGLGARDTLRLEKKYALYGHELSESITPLEAGLGWITKLDKPSFIGRPVLKAMKEQGVPRRLVAIRMNDKGIPRDAYPVFAAGVEVGVVTSGTMSPLLKVGIALALVEASSAAVGTEVEIGIRQRRVAAEIIKPPFV